MNTVFVEAEMVETEMVEAMSLSIIIYRISIEDITGESLCAFFSLSRKRYRKAVRIFIYYPQVK